ncbi:ribbon-helix-helix protein, CopG family [Salinarchaeum sp. IM2453]|uniref:CopG family ribbon-helix-helix protein n=1 Tax=Salinarchaeum sp. IM2453 TaxID=2862870 RepID=UPI001C8347EF|nr:ribbon-helix-helix protein, CopG family [Salinarchaeum sp. IM2453]QZA88470.1 ribbon-helix-helix protein, CopG family [Salinarchaeum sp. IM2453]
MRTSLAVSEEMLDEFDAVREKEGIESRSRAIREAMAEYIERHQRLESVTGDITGVIVFDYEYEHVVTELHTVQHEHADTIISTSHAHHGEWCLETLFVDGPAASVRNLVYRLKSFDGIHRVRTMFL